MSPVEKKLACFVIGIPNKAGSMLIFFSDDKPELIEHFKTLTVQHSRALQRTSNTE